MSRLRFPGFVIALMGAALLLMPGETALAAKAKKMSYDEAWADCKKDVSFLGGDAATTAGRYTRGAACMKKHGYRLKKTSM